MNCPDHNLLRVGGGEHVQAGRRKVRNAVGLHICSVLHLLRAGRAGCDCGLESTLRSFYQVALRTQDLSMSKIYIYIYIYVYIYIYYKATVVKTV